MQAEYQVGAEVMRQMNHLGLRRAYCGITYLTCAVEIVAGDPSVLSDRLVKKWLYPTVGRRCGTSDMNVEASIRWMLGVLWRYGDRDALNQLAGRELTRRPTNCELIAMLTERVKRELDEEAEGGA